MLTLDTLSDAADAGTIDTVLVCLVDMQGRLMGKRFHVRDFLDHSHAETHGCNYLLATDLEMHTVDGYAATSWAAGYGDYVMQPDLSTLRPAPWLDGTALVLCDVLDHHTHAPVPHSPRAVLKAQIARLAERGWTLKAATELEFFLFEGGYDAIRKGGFRDLVPVSGYNEDYNILQTTKEEAVMRPVRNHLFAAGIPVENTKGEAETGQEELNIRYAEALLCADHHVIAKQAVKEIAWAQGVAASFLPKWRADKVGSAAHVHQSLWDGDTPLFHDAEDRRGMSDTMRAWMAGLIAHAGDGTVFLAPYVNSYKRFQKGTFAPTRTAWSVDNRTAGFRLVGEGTKGVRVECRIGGSDLNPYLAIAAQIAAGLAGVDGDLDLAPPIAGDVYHMDDVPEIPRTLRAATEALRGSDMLRAAMGDAVVDHYVRAAEWEQEAFDMAVTDWEIARGFERA
ncbi:glutamine synthetase [Rhodobacteraceae bacterium CCMM004]|nr:glutamine synthetase [Rhodobacteraceae bacterium CCMM004]